MAGIQAFVQVVVCNGMEHLRVCPTAVVSMDHFAHQPEIRLHFICHIPQILHEIKIQDICRIQADSVNIKLLYPEPDRFKMIILYLWMPLVQLD